MTIKIYFNKEESLLRMVRRAALTVVMHGYRPFIDPGWEQHRDLHVVEELGKYGAHLAAMLDGNMTGTVRLADAVIFPDFESLVHFRMVWG